VNVRTEVRCGVLQCVAAVICAKADANVRTEVRCSV